MFDFFKKKKQVEVKAPATGEVVDLSRVSDPTFGQKMLGDGFAVIPSVGEIYAPVDAEVAMVFDTGHACGLKTEDGMEILIHIGIDTVQMKGQGFEPQVKVGDKVSAGTLLIKVDLDQVKEAGYDIITPVIFSNQANFKFDGPVLFGNVNHGDQILSLTKAN
ncbi:MAG: PTS glucose transporter subunit IIA [Pseudobutyrivibrio sp.]|nr:PTS glucose transporter subunit IIA [Pseudobutyrivibrio sp.]